MFHFCTYLDFRYLTRGLALYSSLREVAGPFRLWVLCLDDLTFEILRTLLLPQVVPVPLRDLEGADPELFQTKSNRSPIEYYFTCTPSWPLFILRQNADVDSITYLDADLFFFSDPTPIYHEMDRGSVLIVEHRFPHRLEHMKLYGTYNVGLVSFRRDEKGLKCLESWRERCIEWCYDRAEGGRFADQKYLDDWPTRFPGVVVLQHKGAGLAPWNLDDYSLSQNEGRVFVDSAPLIFYHFQGFKRINAWIYDPGSTAYAIRGNTIVKRCLYGPYWQMLRSIEASLKGNSKIFQTFSFKGNMNRIKRYETPEAREGDNWWGTVKHSASFLENIVSGRYWLFLHGRIL
jgi:hypothetical protein